MANLLPTTLGAFFVDQGQTPTPFPTPPQYIASWLWDGKVMTVRYEAVNAMLLNEFLKEIARKRNKERLSCSNRSRLKL
jgi:hypothetical protein